MKTSSELKSIARDALSGRWGIAILAGFIASLLGGISGSGGGVSVNFSNNSTDVSGSQLPPGVDAEAYQQILTALIALAGIFFVVVIVYAVVALVIGSAVGVGYAKFNLDLVDWKGAKIETMFSRFNTIKTAIAANLLRALYVTLWTLVFVIPGIVAGYSYAMVNYVMAENPGLTAREALRESKRLMDGNRFRLFCLELSFIGWIVLGILTFGIALLWIVPYMQTTLAAFYRDISGTSASGDTPKNDPFDSFPAADNALGS